MKSSQKQLRLLTPIFWLGVIFLFSLSSDPAGPLPNSLVSILSPFAHLMEFTVMGILIYALWPPRYYAKRYILIGVLISLADELLQSYVPGRVTDAWDVAIDITGFMIGIFIAPHLMRFERKIQWFVIVAFTVSVLRFLIW